jgi:hypothetical protein
MDATSEFGWTEELALAQAMRADLTAMHAEVIQQFNGIGLQFDRIEDLLADTSSSFAVAHRKLDGCIASLDRIDAGLERVENDFDRRDE